MNQLNPLMQDAIGAILRHLLGWVASYLITQGIWTQDSAKLYVSGAAMALISLGWSLWRKYAGRLKLVTALTMPEGTTERQCEAQVKHGMTPSVSTPKHVVPVSTVQP